MNQTQCCMWFKSFKESRPSAGEDTRPGRHSASIDDDRDERVSAVICGNRHLIVRKVAYELGMSIISCHQILAEKNHMRSVCAQYVLHLMTGDQKENHFEISQELLSSANSHWNFLRNIITGDETWIYGYNVEVKIHSSKWVDGGKGLIAQKYKRTMDESVKDQRVVGCVFFKLWRLYPPWLCTTWSDGKLTVLPGGLRAFEGCYAQEKSELWGNQTWMLHHVMLRLTRRSSSAVIWHNIRHPF